MTYGLLLSMQADAALKEQMRSVRYLALNVIIILLQISKPTMCKCMNKVGMLYIIYTYIYIYEHIHTHIHPPKYCAMSKIQYMVFLHLIFQHRQHTDMKYCTILYLLTQSE